jgi:hypothetical protein
MGDRGGVARRWSYSSWACHASQQAGEGGAEELKKPWQCTGPRGVLERVRLQRGREMFVPSVVDVTPEKKSLGTKGRVPI